MYIVLGVKFLGCNVTLLISYGLFRLPDKSFIQDLQDVILVSGHFLNKVRGYRSTKTE